MVHRYPHCLRRGGGSAPSSGSFSLSPPSCHGPASYYSELLVTAGPCLRIIFCSREPGSSTHTDGSRDFPLSYSPTLSLFLYPYRPLSLPFSPLRARAPFPFRRPSREFSSRLSPPRSSLSLSLSLSRSLFQPLPPPRPPAVLPSFLPENGEAASRTAVEERALFSIRLDYDTRSRYFPASARQPRPSH